MDLLTPYESERVQKAIEDTVATLGEAEISLHVRRNFETYAAIRRAYGENHLNQAFDPDEVRLGSDDFWLLAENYRGEAIATYCVRRFLIDDFYSLIRSQALWFSNKPQLIDGHFIVECTIPPFGGEVSHGGGLWVRQDYRGCSRLATLMPRFARAIAFRMRPFDHDTGMIRNDPRDRGDVADRKASFMGKYVYGFARVHSLVDGWFPPEARRAVVHLCHSTRAEVVASLAPVPSHLDTLRCLELRKRPLVYQNHQAVDLPTITSEREKQARV